MTSGAMAAHHFIARAVATRVVDGVFAMLVMMTLAVWVRVNRVPLAETDVS
jgi:hypothetical protein